MTDNISTGHTALLKSQTYNINNVYYNKPYIQHKAIQHDYQSYPTTFHSTSHINYRGVISLFDTT